MDFTVTFVIEAEDRDELDGIVETIQEQCNALTDVLSITEIT